MINMLLEKNDKIKELYDELLFRMPIDKIVNLDEIKEILQKLIDECYELGHQDGYLKGEQD